MAVTPKKLFSGLVSTGYTNFFSATKTTMVKKILIHNTDTKPYQFNLNLVSNTGPSQKEAHFFDRVLQPKETIDWSEPFYMNKGDVLICFAPTNQTTNRVSLIVSGAEVE